MDVNPTLNQGDVSRCSAAFLGVIARKQVEYLQCLSGVCVEYVRLIPTNVGFTDQTGNLRLSIEYVALSDGVAVYDNSVQVKESNTGIKEGRRLARMIGSEYPEGVILVVTAGMNHTSYVESKGRDVLTPTKHLA